MTVNEVIEYMKSKSRSNLDLDIINIIIRYYNNIISFYENDMVNVFDNYQKTGILILNLKK